MATTTRTFALAVNRYNLVTMLSSVMLIGTTLLLAALIAWPQDERWDSPHCLWIGFVCGLIAWLFVAVFHLRRETQYMQFRRRSVRRQGQERTAGDGYALSTQGANTLSFRPRFHSYLFGGGIHLTLEIQEAKLTGPKVSLEIFRRCFRLLNHVRRVQLYLQEHRRFTDNVIKRAELQLRLRPDQFEAVRTNIITLLQKEAKVICELNLLVQSEKGIRETTLDFQVREWLEQQGIDFDIHKDIVQFAQSRAPRIRNRSSSTLKKIRIPKLEIRNKFEWQIPCIAKMTE